MFTQRLGQLLAVMLFLASAAPAAAQYRTEGVVFSFMEMRIGATTQYGLMPMATDQVRPDLPPAASVPTAFVILRNGKPATYGNTTVTVTDADAAQGIVSAELWRADAAVTGLASAERALRPGADVNVGWVVMLSANAPDQLRTVCRNVLPAPAWKRHGAAARPLLGIYRQVFSLGRDAN